MSTGPMLVTDVRPWGGAPVDLLVEDGTVSAITDPGGPRPEAGVRHLEGRGRVVVPSFSDVHVHLDSTRLGLPYRPHTSAPGRWGCIMGDRENWRSAERSVAERATYTLERMIALGATTVRSHAQVDVDSGLEKFEGVLAAREAHAGRSSVQVVAFPQVGIHLEGAFDLLDAALRAGADLVGGIDPAEIDGDPVRHVDSVFELAGRHGKGIDIHLHEQGSLGLFDLGLVLDRVAALGMQGEVTVSHAFCLAEDSPQVRRAIDRIAELDVALTTVAPGGGLDLPVERLVTAGIRVGLGMDGQRDYWSPYGNADMLDRAYQLAFTQGYVTEQELELALGVGTWGGRSVIDPGLARLVVSGAGAASRPGVLVGEPADLVLIETECAATGVLDRPAARTVLHRGRVVAEDGGLVT